MIFALVSCALALGCPVARNDPWCVAEPLESNSIWIPKAPPLVYLGGDLRACGRGKFLCYPGSPNGAICYKEM